MDTQYRSIFLHGAWITALLIFGATGGYLARENWLAPYRAVSFIPLELTSVREDPKSDSFTLYGIRDFKLAESMLYSRSSIERFAAVHGLSNDAMIVDFEKQLAAGRRQPVTIDMNFLVANRADVRDLPEALTREMLKGAVARTILSVQVSHIDVQEVVRRLRIMLDYTRDTMLRTVLTERLQSDFAEAQNEKVRLITKTSAFRWKLEALTRQISKMSEIRNKFSNLEPVQEHGTGSDRETIQVPMNETRFLSPSRQLVGLETLRADLEEQLRLSLAGQERVDAVLKFVSTMIDQARIQGDSEKLLEVGFSQMDQIQTTSANVDARFAVQDAQNTLRELLVGLKNKYSRSWAAPFEYRVFRTGPGLAASVGGGAFLGLLFSLILIRLCNGHAIGRGSRIAGDDAEIDLVNSTKSVRNAQ